MFLFIFCIVQSKAAEIRKLHLGLSVVKQPAEGKLTGLRLWDQQKGRENRPGSESEWQISQMDTNYNYTHRISLL